MLQRTKVPGMSGRRWLAAGLLFMIALFVTGCFESKEDITLNPDGSGKLILEAIYDPSAMTLGQGDSSRAMEDSVKSILQKSQGIDAWKDVVFKKTADGRVSFKGTAYFKDLSKVKIENYGMDFLVTKEGNTLTIQKVEKEEKSKSSQKNAAAPASEEDPAQEMEKARREWARTKPMMSAMLGDLKQSATLHLPGKIVDINNFTKVSDNTVSVSIEGAKLIETMDRMMNDEALLKKLAAKGDLPEGGGPPSMGEDINEIYFGKPGPLQVKVQAGSKPQFDYKKESTVAAKAYPALMESLGVVPKLPSGSQLKDGISFQAGEVKDSRTTGKFFGDLEVEMVMEGAILSRARGIRRIEIQKAVDNTGTDIRNTEKESEPSDFSFHRGSSQEESSQVKQSLKLKNPARSANSISVSGTVDLYVPEKDARSVVIIKGFMKQTGKPLVSDLLKKSKVDVAVLTKAQYDAAKEAKEKQEGGAAKSPAAGLLSVFSSLGSSFMSVDENDLAFMINDPGSRVVDVEVQDASGKPLDVHGRSIYGKERVLNFEELPPAASQLAIYLETTASLVSAPFAMENIALP